MSDLMAMSVGELAAHVRGGELRAREVVTAALERIEERNGEINAFVEVDADGALATADTIEPGDERRSRACRSRSRPTRRSKACG
jgi:Asp-tRNA(Asn)/Glu-tRNA(Gln) amidotransferase A subunit family amidase